MRTPALIILLMLSLHFRGQTDSTHKAKNRPHLCHVKLVDGSSYKGIIENKGDSILWLRSSSGVLVQIPRNKIHSVERIEVRTIDSVSYVNPTSETIGKEYYVFTRNAFLFKSKRVYGSSNYAMFYTLNYAFDKNFSIGISATPVLAPLIANVKGNFMLGHKFYLGTGMALGTLSWPGPKTYIFGGELKLTFGDEFRNFTFTCGYGELDLWRVARRRGRRGPLTPGNFYDRFYSPYAGISATTLAFRRTFLAAEAFIYPNINIYTVSIAARTNVWQRFSLAGGFILLGSTNLNGARSPLPFWYITLPTIGFSYRF